MFTLPNARSEEQPALFGDFSELVYDYVDKGLTSLACHPNYPEDPFIYLLTSADEDAYGRTPAYLDNCPTQVLSGEADWR